MKNIHLVFIFLGFFILVLISTNPTLEDHRQSVYTNIKDKSNEEKPESREEYNWNDARQRLDVAIQKLDIVKSVARKNFFLFSLTYLPFEEDEDYSELIGCGILGNVFIFNDELNNTTTSIIELKKEKIKRQSLKKFWLGKYAEPQYLISSHYYGSEIEILSKDEKDHYNFKGKITTIGLKDGDIWCDSTEFNVRFEDEKCLTLKSIPKDTSSKERLLYLFFDHGKFTLTESGNNDFTQMQKIE